MTSKPSKLSREDRQTIINVCLTGGVACALAWSLIAAVSAGQARDMIEEATASPITSELGGIVDPGNIAAALDTACPTEDSVNCYWVAENQGNGEGESFVNIEGHVFPLTSLLG